MGCTVIIPSNLRISAIGSQMVTWSVAKGTLTVLEDTMTDAKHNLILVNVQKTDEGTYYATGSNSEGSENGPSVTLAVAEEPGENIYIYKLVYVPANVLLFVYIHKCICIHAKYERELGDYMEEKDLK